MTSTARKRRGTASIIGTIIFVGILFTSVLPLIFLTKQTDNYYTQKRLEAEQEDLVRAREEVELVAYPTGEAAPDNLTFKVTNRSVQAVDLIRLWVNDHYYTLTTSLGPSESEVLGSYDVNPTSGSTYNIRITTSNGNVFDSCSPIKYIDGHWEVENLLIYVLVSSQGTIFKVDLYRQDGETWPFVEEQIVQKQGGGGSALATFDITGYGSPQTYRVIVKKGASTVHDEYVVMDWPSGSPYKWIYS